MIEIIRESVSKVRSERSNELWRTVTRIIWWLSVAAAVVLMVWAIWTSVLELKAQHLHLDSRMVIVSLVVRSIALFMNIYLWDMILRASGARVSFLRNFKFFCYTNIVKRLPTPLWLVSGRMHLYEQVGTNIAVTSTSIGIEMLLALTSGSILMLALMPIGLPSLPAWAKLMSVAGAVTVWLVSSEPRLLKVAGKVVGKLFRQPISSLGEIRRRDLLYWTLVHTLSWMMGGTMMYFVLGILMPLDVSFLVKVIWAWAVSGVFGFVRFLAPFLFAAREISLAFLLAMVGLSPLAVVAVSAALSRLCLIVGDLIWAGIALMISE